MLPYRPLYNLNTPRRGMIILDADPGGSGRVRFLVNVFLCVIKSPSCASPGEGLP